MSTSEVLTNVALILLFICIGGVFSGAEMALVSLRESQVKNLAGRGKRGEAVARLTSDPNLFLSAVQIGVTLSGFLSSAFGGATLAPALSPVLVEAGLPSSLANTAALVLITIAISYFSIVLGELTAKRIAMQRAEGFSLAIAPLVDSIARITRPVIWFLGKSTDAAVRLLGGDPKASREEVTNEELRQMVVGSQTLGAEERHIVDEVFEAGERSLREVMVPRTEVDFLPGDMPAYKAIREVQGAPHSRYPVTDGSRDRIVGFLHVRDLMDMDPSTRSTPIKQLVRPVLSLPETVRVLRALTAMRRAHSHLAIVRDEYGGTAGIVTLEDLVEELIGDITDEYDLPPAGVHTQVNDIDGLMTLEDFADKFGYLLPEGPYDTVAGYFLAQSGTVPALGDEITVELDRDPESDKFAHLPEHSAVVFRVTELDGRRASWLSVRRRDDVPSVATGATAVAATVVDAAEA
ncbi:MAG: hemolysin family protein [Luteococcus sp.]|uniref:hemolysin family protein n=1 Tax=Luteococcus sp. TaxID=1969402 RepID=UPI002648BE62|nr:hemolysin family protein [Luteococcus sp.]MDN5563516.1 hemolysin family protein [Luteococcus sp.]